MEHCSFTAPKGPQTATAGELAHLRTDIRFALPSTGMLGSLLRALHPTPAVCGLPKDEAFRFIGAHEGYDRSYYAGFLGRLSPGGHTALYVNLRCMACSGETGAFRLYAGGGLLPESVLDISMYGPSLKPSSAYQPLNIYPLRTISLRSGSSMLFP